MEKLTLTVAEACAISGCGRTKLYQMISSGQLRAIKLGRSTRILATDLKEWVAKLPTINATTKR